jgi:uncharacterized heparinase superfamily protein
MISLELFGKALDDEFVQVIYGEIYREYKYIESHLEKHLLGNHYFENLKAMVIGSYLFGEDNKCRKYFQLLEKEIHEQILDDGMHFELSPMYHKIILEDLLRLRRLQSIEGLINTSSLESVIKVMCVAMKTLEDGFDRTPLFNDAGDNVAKPKEDLEAAVKDICHIYTGKAECLPSAGYYRLQGEDFVVLFDAGKISPDYMPGHGHCDCLSYELAYKGTPMIVNAGTFQYQGRKSLLSKHTST